MKALIVCFTLGLIGNIVGTALPVRAAELESYERKYIGFLPANYPQLNQAMITEMQTELPRFTYYALPELSGSLEDFAAALYAYQQQHAGEIAANQTLPDLKYGDKTVSWSDTRKIIESAFMMVPHWQFGSLELKNLHQRGGSWYVDLTSPLTLELGIYKIENGKPVHYTTLQDNFVASESVPVPNFSSLLSDLSKSTGGIVDPENPLVHPLIIEAVKALPGYAEMLRMDPAQRMASVAPQSLAKANYDPLIKSLKQQNAFILKNQVETVDASRDQLVVNLPAGETASSLGAWLDQGYKVIEYQLQNGKETPVEVGYAKIREFNEQQLRLQPIMGARDFELGDQLIEYPQTGINAQLFAGTSALGFDQQAGNMFAPQAGLRFEYSLARLSGVSELYLALSGSAGLPFGIESLPAARRQGVQTGALAVPFTAELGLFKRWYLRQWMLELGVQGGLLGGALLNSGEQNTPSSFSPMATALLGTGWQINPDFLVGLQGGWRFSLPGSWKVENDFGTSTLNLPGLSANGPIIQIYGHYSF